MPVKLGTVSQLRDDYSDEWYTPKRIIEEVRQTLGEIDLDPASCEFANRTVKAKRIYTREDNGLTKQWYGKVFCNPPYSKVPQWVNKIADCYDCGEVSEAIFLINAWCEARWFQRLWDYPICFVRGRIQFYSPDGRYGGMPSNSAIIYFGKDVELFAKRFCVIGTTVVKYTYQNSRVLER